MVIYNLEACSYLYNLDSRNVKKKSSDLKYGLVVPVRVDLAKLPS